MDVGKRGSSLAEVRGDLLQVFPTSSCTMLSLLAQNMTGLFPGILADLLISVRSTAPRSKCAWGLH